MRPIGPEECVGGGEKIAGSELERSRLRTSCRSEDLFGDGIEEERVMAILER